MVVRVTPSPCATPARHEGLRGRPQLGVGRQRGCPAKPPTVRSGQYYPVLAALFYATIHESNFDLRTKQRRCGLTNRGARHG